MDWHPIQGGVEIFLVASCHGNRDKLRPGGPLGSYADFTFTLHLTASRTAFLDKIDIRPVWIKFLFSSLNMLEQRKLCFAPKIDIKNFYFQVLTCWNSENCVLHPKSTFVQFGLNFYFQVLTCWNSENCVFHPKSSLYMLQNQYCVFDREIYISSFMWLKSALHTTCRS